MLGALLIMFMITFLIITPIYWWLEKVYKDKKKYVTLLCVSLLPLIMFGIYTFLTWMDYDAEKFNTNIRFALFIGSPILLPDLLLLLFACSKLTKEDSNDE